MRILFFLVGVLAGWLACAAQLHSPWARWGHPLAVVQESAFVGTSSASAEVPPAHFSLLSGGQVDGQADAADEDNPTCASHSTACAEDFIKKAVASACTGEQSSSTNCCLVIPVSGRLMATVQAAAAACAGSAPADLWIAAVVLIALVAIGVFLHHKKTAARATGLNHVEVHNSRLEELQAAAESPPAGTHSEQRLFAARDRIVMRNWDDVEVSSDESLSQRLERLKPLLLEGIKYQLQQDELQLEAQEALVKVFSKS